MRYRIPPEVATACLDQCETPAQARQVYTALALGELLVELLLTPPPPPRSHWWQLWRPRRGPVPAAGGPGAAD